MSCPRLFEVEANRDGRLSGSERASFERHLSVCAECTAEAETLAHLAALARERPAHLDDLRAPRGRIKLIGAFDRELTDPTTRRPQVVTVALLGALAMAAIYILVRSPSTPNVALPDRARVVASEKPATSMFPDGPVVPSALPSARPARTPIVLAAEPEDEYRAALAKLEAGDDVAAAAAFERFVAKYPKHVHAEDASYLRVIAFQHAADRAAMQSAAADYLRAFPNGFRAKEVEKLAH